MDILFTDLLDLPGLKVSKDPFAFARGRETKLNRAYNV